MKLLRAAAPRCACIREEISTESSPGRAARPRREEIRKNVNRLNRACQADGLPALLSPALRFSGFRSNLTGLKFSTMPDLGGQGDSRCRYSKGSTTGKCASAAPGRTCHFGRPQECGSCYTRARTTRTAARTRQRPTETAWTIWSGSNPGLWVVMSLVYTRPGGASSLSGGKGSRFPQGPDSS